jgi:hypothetical protein
LRKSLEARINLFAAHWLQTLEADVVPVILPL